LKEQLTNIDRLKELGTKGMDTIIKEHGNNFEKLKSALDKPMKLALSSARYEEFKALTSEDGVNGIKQFVQNIKDEMAEKSKLAQQKLKELGIAQNDNQALLNQYLGNTTQVTQSNEPIYKPDEKEVNAKVEDQPKANTNVENKNNNENKVENKK
jgi:hypothetical protein